MSYAVGMVSGIQMYLTSTGGAHAGTQHGASACIACGACEKKCPQHIPIIESLGAVRKRMEPWYLRLAVKIVMRFL
jgi:predicted aldo/keto reductase-like oxidoreductase